jgi:hypothetical protein
MTREQVIDAVGGGTNMVRAYLRGGRVIVGQLKLVADTGVLVLETNTHLGPPLMAESVVAFEAIDAIDAWAAPWRNPAR